MRRITVLAALALALMVQSGTKARAEVWYPWCVYYGWTTYNCGFVSYAQCMATASGDSRAYCRRNPAPPPPARQR